MALARFGPGGRFADIKEIATRFYRDAGVVSRAIAEAFAKHLVEVRRVEQKPDRQPHWEELLVQKYQLQVAIVVRPPHRENDDEDSDEVHALLGRALAELLSNGTLFRSGDAIGLGSGRGVFTTVDALANFPRLRVPGVTLLSLTGDVYPRHHSRDPNLCLDADTHVNLLGRCFAQDVTLHFLSSSICYEEQRTLESVRRRTWLNPERGVRLTHVITGVGILGPGHRFYEMVRRKVDDTTQPEPEVPARLLGLLDQLLGYCERIHARCPGYWPVADICNSMFRLPAPTEMVTAQEAAAIDQLVASINDNLLNVKPDELRAVPNMILVAGTRLKAAAIRSLLDGGQYNIRFLCTDEPTAKAILGE